MLYVKLEKCEFAQMEITFLGHKISVGLIKMDEGKMQSIKEWLVPSKLTELRSISAWSTTTEDSLKGIKKWCLLLLTC